MPAAKPENRFDETPARPCPICGKPAAFPTARFVQSAAPTSIFTAGSAGFTPFRPLMNRTRNPIAQASRPVATALSN
jgi:hypothetical protein